MTDFKPLLANQPVIVPLGEDGMNKRLRQQDKAKHDAHRYALGKGFRVTTEIVLTEKGFALQVVRQKELVRK